MILQNELRRRIRDGEYDGPFSRLYPGTDITECRKRYCDALGAFSELFGEERPVAIISAPGRTEIGGNHTDHQRGRVLAAAVNLDIVCIASPNDDNVIRLQSKGYPLDTVSLDDLSARESERGSSSALIRGIAAWFSEHGHTVEGFDAYTTSDVLGGSGLSSSAAFEVAVGNILNTLFENAATPVDIAVAGQYAENEYLGKPCGLMDQTASSTGGLVQIDFEKPKNPVIRSISFDLEKSGFKLCIIDTKGSHADLTDDYADITLEMGKIARELGKSYLREVDPEIFRLNLAKLRGSYGDRAVLRAMHFFHDNALVPMQAEALSENRVNDFLEMVVRSGRSSFCCLQNVFSLSAPHNQGLSLALALSEEILAGKGAWRVHGGGFAGTIQAFVPKDMVWVYKSEMDSVFGENACHILSIRTFGGIEVTANLKEAVTNG